MANLMPGMGDERVAAEVGKRLRGARLKRDIKQQWIALQLGVSTSTICHWEHGTRTLSLVQYVRYCDSLGVPPHDLLNGQHFLKDQGTPPPPPEIADT